MKWWCEKIDARKELKTIADKKAFDQREQLPGYFQNDFDYISKTVESAQLLFNSEKSKELPEKYFTEFERYKEFQKSLAVIAKAMDFSYVESKSTWAKFGEKILNYCCGFRGLSFEISAEGDINMYRKNGEAVRAQPSSKTNDQEIVIELK